MKVELKKAGPLPQGSPVTPQPAPVAAAIPATAPVAPPAPTAIPQAAAAPAAPAISAASIPGAPAVQPPPAAAVPPPAPVPAPQAQPPAASVPDASVVPPPAPVAPPVPIVATPDPVMAPQTAAPAPTAVATTVPVSVVSQAAPVGVITTPEDREENRQLAAQNMFGQKNGGMEGDWDQSNIILPRLQIVQGSGPLAQRFPGGTLLLADEVFLPAPNAQNPPVPVNFVPIQCRKQFREKVEQNSGLKARIAFSKDEVRALGGTTEWVGNTKPTWDETARTVALIQKPNGVDHPAFSTVEGIPGEWAVVVFYAAGASFKYFGEVLATAAASVLRVPTATPGQTVPYLPKRWWRLTVQPKPWGKYNPYAFVGHQTTIDTDLTVRTYVNGFMNKTVADE